MNPQAERSVVFKCDEAQIYGFSAYNKYVLCQSMQR